MSRLPPNLLRLDRLRIANVYLVGPPGDRWLVDTGHRLERRALLAALRRCGLVPSDLAGVVLTHYHSDHAGNAHFLQQTFGLPIAAHRADAALLASQAPRPRLERRTGNQIAGAFCAFENYWPARPLTVDRPLDDGDTLGSLEIHWVGGHTPGSVFLRHTPTGALLPGDLLLTAHPPLVVREGFALPYPSFTADMDQALASLRTFHTSGVPYSHLLPGHGPMWLDDARDRVVEGLTSLQVL